MTGVQTCALPIFGAEVAEQHPACGAGDERALLDDANAAQHRGHARCLVTSPRRSPAERCRQMVARSRPDGATIALTVYPGAHHAFDVAELKPGIRFLGHWLEYNEPVAKDAAEKTRAFLADHLAETSPGEPTAK